MTRERKEAYAFVAFFMALPFLFLALVAVQNVVKSRFVDRSSQASVSPSGHPAAVARPAKRGGAA